LNWFNVEITCSKDDVVLIEEIMIANGAVSISISNKGGESIYEPSIGETPLWEKSSVKALFAKKKSKKYICSILSSINYYELSISNLKDKNWIEEFQNKLKPKKFGDSLWVFPSWYDLEKYNDEKIIKMDPGMAFGSGSHETTHLCLDYLESINLKSLSMIDYGCGSGILGIAALLLKAKNVIAVDLDPQAIISTKKNSILNQVEKNIEVFTPNELKNQKVDVIIANILALPLINLRDKFIKLLKPNGILIISGIMEKQLNKVKVHYEEFFSLQDIKVMNDWCLISFKRL